MKFFHFPPCTAPTGYDILCITFWNTGLWRNWLAHWTVDPGVAGSSPVDPASTEGRARLPRGVMVALQILILPVGVRVPARQPTNLKEKANKIRGAVESAPFLFRHRSPCFSAVWRRESMSKKATPERGPRAVCDGRTVVLRITLRWVFALRIARAGRGSRPSAFRSAPGRWRP